MADRSPGWRGRVWILAAWLGGPAYGAGLQGDILFFSEQEPAQPIAMAVRMLVTDDFLRIDDGVDTGDFLLLDRRARRIYNVVAEDRTILAIRPLEMTVRPPATFEHHTEAVALSQAPAIEADRAKGFALMTNGRVCFQLTVVVGLLEPARQALIELRTILAGEHAVIMPLTPADLQSACDLANNIFLPTRHLQQGFPVRQEDMDGRVRVLTEYRTAVALDPALFVLPQGYRRYSTAQMRGEEGPGAGAE